MTLPTLAPDRPRKHYDPMDTFRFIVDYKRTHEGNRPTIREIMHACGHLSTSTVYAHLLKLERQGRIVLPKVFGTTRYIAVVGGQWTYAPRENQT